MAGCRGLRGGLVAVLCSAGSFAIAVLGSGLMADAAPGVGGKGAPKAVSEASLSERTGAKRTDAERISTIRKLLEADQKYQADLAGQLESLEGRFEQASGEFSRIDTLRNEARQRLATAKESAEQEGQQRELNRIEAEWKEARDDFDFVIRQRKAVRQQLDTLEEKIEIEEQALEQLTSTKPSEEAIPAAPSAVEAVKVEAKQEAEPAKPGPPSIVGAPANGSTAEKPAAPAKETPFDNRVIDAKRDLLTAQTGLKRAQSRAELLDSSIDIFERDLTSSRELLATLREQGDVKRQQIAALREKRDAEEQDSTAWQELNAQLSEAEEQHRESVKSLTEQTARIAESEATLAHLKQLTRKHEDAVEDAEGDVEKVENRIAFLQSPMAPHHVRNWISTKGPHVLFLTAVTVGLWWLARTVVSRVVTALASHSRRGSESERMNRAETLRRVIQNTVSIVIVVVGSLAVLNEAGLNVTVLLGGAAVFGAAVAFGSQNLIKDYFSGFMILLENQYSVGNVVRIGTVSGSVEDITLRVTVLRDEEGIVHFIPHSEMKIVSNLTYGWSRAVFKIRVDYNQDIDQVIEVLQDLSRQLRDDEQFGPQMLGEPEMLGIDSLEASGVVVKFLIKTRPLKQWAVKRELLRRIKEKFAELGIYRPALVA